jgi:hypothetical protein
MGDIVILICANPEMASKPLGRKVHVAVFQPNRHVVAVKFQPAKRECPAARPDEFERAAFRI